MNPAESHVGPHQVGTESPPKSRDRAASATRTRVSPVAVSAYLPQLRLAASVGEASRGSVHRLDDCERQAGASNGLAKYRSCARPSGLVDPCVYAPRRAASNSARPSGPCQPTFPPLRPGRARKVVACHAAGSAAAT